MFLSLLPEQIISFLSILQQHILITKPLFFEFQVIKLPFGNLLCSIMSLHSLHQLFLSSFLIYFQFMHSLRHLFKLMLLFFLHQFSLKFTTWAFVLNFIDNLSKLITCSFKSKITLQRRLTFDRTQRTRDNFRPMKW